MVKRASTVGEVIGERVEAYRLQQGLTQREVSERTADLGHPIERTVLAKIENGGSRAQNLSVVDLIVLAAALDVPPPLLILPLGRDEVVALTPKIKIHPHLALDWITGTGPLVWSDRRAKNVGAWNANTYPMWLFQELRELQDEVESARHQGPKAVDVALTALDEHRKHMERAGLSLPELPDPWARRLETLRKKSTRRPSRATRRSTAP